MLLLNNTLPIRNMLDTIKRGIKYYLLELLPHVWDIIPIITALIIAVVVAIPEYIVWNHIMPHFFGASTVTYWQSLGITFVATLLVKLLFRFLHKRRKNIKLSNFSGQISNSAN